MRKILIIGSSGAGKTTFARRLHDITKLKLVHLDKIYWQPNWVATTDKAAWRETVAEILRGDEWIIDGNYGSTLAMRLEACDTVILLDFPNYVCAWRVLKRIAFYRSGSRPDMAEGCPERFDWKFLKWVWTYPTRSKPNVEALLKQFENQKTVIRLGSNGEVEKFLMNLSLNKVEFE